MADDKITFTCPYCDVDFPEVRPLGQMMKCSNCKAEVKATVVGPKMSSKQAAYGCMLPTVIFALIVYMVCGDPKSLGDGLMTLISYASVVIGVCVWLFYLWDEDYWRSRNK